jgi:thioredoxin-like negative regulator of GroEL
VKSAFVAALLPITASAAGVQFRAGDFAGALAEAQRAKKPLMVDVFATWCGPCQELDAKVYGDDEAARTLNDTFVSFKIDGEKGEGPALMKRYNAVGFPTVLFLTPQGEEIDRIFGYLPKDEYVKTALGYAEGKGTLADAEKQFSKDAGQLAFRWAVKGDEKKAQRYLALLEETGTPAELAETRFSIARYLYLRGQKDYKRALAEFDAIRRDYPGTEAADGAAFERARAFKGLGDLKAVKAALDEWLAAHAKESNAHNSYAWFCFKQEVFLEEGIAAAKKGLELNPRNDALWDTLAELLNKVGRKKDAVAAIEKALEVKPGDAYYVEQKKRFQ